MPGETRLLRLNGSEHFWKDKHQCEVPQPVAEPQDLSFACFALQMGSDLQDHKALEVGAMNDGALRDFFGNLNPVNKGVHWSRGLSDALGQSPGDCCVWGGYPSPPPRAVTRFPQTS